MSHLVKIPTLTARTVPALAGATPAEDNPLVQTAGATILALSIGASAYHGYKRNKSVGWALWWALMGGIAPIVAPAIALAQGFGKPKAAKNPSRKRRRRLAR